MMPRRYLPLTSSKKDRDATKARIRFLVDLWDYEPSAYTFIGTRGVAGWRDHAIVGDRATEIAKVLAAHPVDNFDIYFCPNAFAEPRRQTTLALPTRYAWCDIDTADPAAYKRSPNILWETSPGHFQGIWAWRTASDGLMAEQYSRNLVYREGGDRTGWSVTKMLRLPGTINHKECYRRPVVRLLSHDLKPQRMPLTLAFVRLRDLGTSPRPIDARGHDPAKVLKKYRREVGAEVSQLIRAKRVTRPDRSKRVYQIVAALVEAGASDDEIAAVLLVNPYFTSKWGGNVDKACSQIARIRARLGTAR